MTKQELSIFIHEWNTSCKKKLEKNGLCKDCWRLAGHILILLGTESTREGAKRFDETKLEL